MPASNEWFSGPMNGNSDIALRKLGLRRETAQRRNQGKVHGHSELHTTLYETQYRWQTTPHFQHRRDRVFLFILFLPKIVTKKTAKRCEVHPCRKGWERDCCCKPQCKWCSYSPFVIAKGFEMYEQNLPAGTEISLTTFSWIDSTPSKCRSQGCLGQAFFSCVPKCMNYLKDSDIKILCPPPHTTYVLRPLHRTVSKPFKTNCHQETIKFIHNSANDAITKFSFEQHFLELLG